MPKINKHKQYVFVDISGPVLTKRRQN